MKKILIFDANHTLTKYQHFAALLGLQETVVIVSDFITFLACVPYADLVVISDYADSNVGKVSDLQQTVRIIREKKSDIVVIGYLHNTRIDEEVTKLFDGYFLGSQTLQFALSKFEAYANEISDLKCTREEFADFFILLFLEKAARATKGEIPGVITEFEGRVQMAA